MTRVMSSCMVARSVNGVSLSTPVSLPVTDLKATRFRMPWVSYETERGKKWEWKCIAVWENCNPLQHGIMGGLPIYNNIHTFAKDSMLCLIFLFYKDDVMSKTILTKGLTRFENLFYTLYCTAGLPPAQEEPQCWINALSGKLTPCS